VQSVSFIVGTYAGFLSGPLGIQIGNDVSGYPDHSGLVDYFCIQGLAPAGCAILPPQINAPLVDGWRPTQFDIGLLDPTGTALASDALPFGPLDPTKFMDPDLTHIQLAFTSPQGLTSAVVANFTPVISTPEPNSLALLGAALVWGSALRWRRRSKSNH
jgi:hypothetical protein